MTKRKQEFAQIVEDDFPEVAAPEVAAPEVDCVAEITTRFAVIDAAITYACHAPELGPANGLKDAQVLLAQARDLFAKYVEGTHG